MKIVAISDIHGYLPKSLPAGDVLVIAGDIAPDIRPLDKQASWMRVQFTEWLRPRVADYRNIIIVPGNHDYWGWEGQNHVGWFIHDELNSFEDGPPPSFVYICEEPTTLELGKYLFYVNPYCLSLPGWAYQTNEEELADMYRKIPLGVDVIVSHGPSLDYCDKIIKESGSFHAGSVSLKNAIKKAKPKVVICGHIHESEGTYTLHHHGTSDITVIHNCSQLDINYKYHNRPHIIEI